MVTPEEFDTLDQDKLQYNYSWIYDKQPKTEKEEKDVSEELIENIGEIVTLEAFVPRIFPTRAPTSVTRTGSAI